MKHQFGDLPPFKLRQVFTYTGGAWPANPVSFVTEGPPTPNNPLTHEVPYYVIWSLRVYVVRASSAQASAKVTLGWRLGTPEASWTPNATDPLGGECGSVIAAVTNAGFPHYWLIDPEQPERIPSYGVPALQITAGGGTWTNGDQVYCIGTASVIP